ncbi:AraC family transcriptional regulator [Parasphingopyxis marina]|uniref:AraC family transcriptional regulator ligand-binding domain-containing protein n=1 Tax=Parasphingopyxis marina TaxID=2761622 RepID=A0A842I2Y2_9SPHN|nr:AraC family transcriptional regulator [Parasphingopyxis marina]MBC2779149.1 AraC family transcriptional regulator ligand-binding domain-containing protein [Parasphingopyxis marina]
MGLPDNEGDEVTIRNDRSGFPSLNQRIFAPFKIATVIDTVASRGMSAETVLERTGLSSSDVRDPHTLTSIGQYLTACENIIAAGAGFADAFAIGSRLHLSAYGMYGYALMCSPTMRDFFDFAVRYQPLATPTVRLHWRMEGDVAIWQFREIYRDRMSDDVRTFLVRQQLKMTFTHIRDAAGTDNLPLRALFALPEDDHTAQDARELECPCLYDEAANELHYPIGILDRTPELGNRLTRTMLEETCERLIGQTRISSGLSGEVYQLLLSAPGQFPSMTAVAAQLGLQERTLRRRLAAEDATYGAIVDDVRRKLAIEYLHTTRMSVDDVAWKVGFSDSANLRRAVRRWTNKTVKEIRAEK